MKKNIYFKIFLFLSFLLPLLIYKLTLCPVVYTEDCGEFIAGAYTLGVVHPPGYPLYCMLGKLFTLIPYGSVALRVNFMSSFFGALTGIFLYLLIYRLTKKEILSFFSAAFFCFTPAFWSQCVVAEVYSLNILFLTLCLYILDLWREKKNDKFLYLFSFMYGLSLTNHYFMLLAGPFFILFILLEKPGIVKKPAFILGCLVIFIAGFLPYLYLPLASKANPALNWGRIDTLERFLCHIQRKMYSDTSIGGFEISVKFQFIKEFLAEFVRQYGILLIIIGFLGLWRLFIKDIKFFVLSFGIFLFNGIFLIFIMQHPFNMMWAQIMSVYYFPCYLVFACYIGIGFSFLYESLGPFFRKYYFLKVSFAAAILLLLFIQIYVNYHKNDLSKNYFVYDYVKSGVNLTDKDAILFTAGDAFTFTVLYLKECEHYRRDITMYDNTGALSGEYLGKDMIFGSLQKDKQDEIRRSAFNEIIDANYGKRPVYFNYDFYLGPDSKYQLKSYGIIYKVVRKDRMPQSLFAPLEKIKIRNLYDGAVYKSYAVRELAAIYWDTLAFYYIDIKDNKNVIRCYEEIYKYDNYGSLNNAAGFFLNSGRADLALPYLKKAAPLNPDYFPIHFNTALAYELLGQKEEALKNYIIAVKKYDGDLRFKSAALFAEGRIKARGK